MAALAGPALPAHPLWADSPRPNIVHIFADDLGWGSVGFNGQTQIATPNLDAIASVGMTLTNAYAAPVCAPSRAMLLTGFHQGHASIDGNNGLDTGFRAEDVMTAQVLAPAGYTSAIFGKWGFGADGVRSLTGSDPVPTITTPDSLPTNHGFDSFYGYLNHGAAHDYFYDWMWQDDSGAPQGVSTTPNNGGPGGTREYSHDLFAAQSEQFVAAHAGDSSPFYMQMNYTVPHWDIDAISSAPGGYGMYAGEPWTSKQKAYAAMITRMDASIGALIERLDDPDGNGDNSDSILSNTLVLITSDNGPSVEDDSPIDFFNANGEFRGGKFEVYEGGIHMPTLAYWPGTIAPGSVSDYRTDVADFMATAADLAGVEAPVGIDGTSIVPTLTGEGHQRQRDYLVFEHQGAHGNDPDPRIGRWAVVRQDGMKLIRYDNDTQELFNLVTDPDESSPLSLGVPANAQIASELEAAAIAEGLLRGVVEYRTWTGPSGGNLQDAANWDGIGRPHGYWSAVVSNNSAMPRIAHVSDDVATLGVEVRGQSALQVVDVHAGRSLTGQNEVRIGANGRVDLSGGTLATSRWVNVRAGGELRGQGTVAGDLYNEGVVSPGRPDDSPAWPVAPPPALPPITLNTGTGLVTAFNFTGVQDDVPLLATSILSQYLEVSKGLDFGPGVGPRLGNGGTDEGNEFNVAGHTGATLQQAIDAGDYLTFSVDPIAGAGVIPSSISFRLWRNGGASAKNFAILSSVGGFTSGAALVQATYTDTGIGNQHTLTAGMPAVEAMTEPVEFRLYGWGANAATGSSHVNAALLNARFMAVPTLEFDFSGVQDQAPLTALRRQDDNLALTAGLNFGLGVAPRSPGGGGDNAGDEFHVAGFSTGSTLQSAIDDDDYLSFSVQAVSGIAMYPDSVSFNLWRQASGSATDYAILSSIDGFTSGQQLTESNLTTVGAGNQQLLTGSFVGAQPTTDPVEFRLYGWNAATDLDSTHLVGASMRARFASVAGSPIDPTGTLTVQGDYYHLEGGALAIDLGGNAAGVDYDVVNVLGKVELEGDLSVSLADAGGSPFAPALGDSFSILTATVDITGEFADVSLPQLSMELAWQIDYLPSAVTLTVFSSADFNRDRVVDAADYTIWRDSLGQEGEQLPADGDGNGIVDPGDYALWQSQFGQVWPESGSASGANVNATPAVPEPSSLLLCSLVVAPFLLRRRVRGGRRQPDHAPATCRRQFGRCSLTTVRSGLQVRSNVVCSSGPAFPRPDVSVPGNKVSIAASRWIPARSMPRLPATLRLLMLVSITLAVQAVGTALGADVPVSFARDVKPILSRRCFSCHGPTASEGGLRLDTPETAFAELDSGGLAIVPGQVDQSALVSRVSSSDEAERMPLEDKPLTKEEIETLKRWIAAGAKWESHWAFVPPRRGAPPPVHDDAWVENPIDAFVLARLEQADLHPAPPADNRTLVRRAYFDVTGLPPTSEQVETFLNDSAPDAWERLVDSLLASPHYGEHWARHWLDLVRFAETNSYERDGLKPNAWKYRDYVIRSFNDDKPYDQFVREQLAGDELDNVTDDTIIATGYYRLGIWDDDPVDLLQARYDELDDILSTTSQAMLGLTVGCARCHDHKIDPIPQADYYGLLAFFAGVTSYGGSDKYDPDRFSQWEMSKPQERTRRAELHDKENKVQAEKTALEETGIQRMAAVDQGISRTPGRERLILEKLEQYLDVSEWGLYQDTIRRLAAVQTEINQLPPRAAALALAECEPHPQPTHILVRGNPHVPGDEVEPHFPAIFAASPPSIPPAAEGARSSGRRRVLAEWIASPQNMLTARVIANRVWQQHFGRGLVRSANNFGEQGTPPTHPELLDWLALWLVDHHWQLKPLHQLIMTSNTYRMSSTGNQQALEVDPTNDLFWRFDIRRLSAEEIRDAILVTSGQFNAQMYGPGFYPKLSTEVLATQSRPGDGWGNSSPEDQARRSIYIHVKRSLLTPLLTTFDFPDVDSSCEARFVTTQPGQALAMLHDGFVIEQADKLAVRVETEAGEQPRAQVAKAIWLALGRAATEAEIADGLGLLERLEGQHGRAPHDALTYWCLAVLNLNEFVYLD